MGIPTQTKLVFAVRFFEPSKLGKRGNMSCGHSNTNGICVAVRFSDAAKAAEKRQHALRKF